MRIVLPVFDLGVVEAVVDPDTATELPAEADEMAEVR